MSYVREARGTPAYKPSQYKPYQYYSFVPPVRGWVSAEAYSAMRPGGAVVLENFRPTTTGIKPRGGCDKHATLGTQCVKSFLIYSSGAVENLFAASNGGIYEITTVADPDVAPTPDITGQTSDDYSSVMMSTAGGEYLIAVNGADLHQVYDGAAWAQNTPAITGTTSDNFSAVFKYRYRLYFIKDGTMTVCYLPVDSIGGAVSDFNLAGVFTRGGALSFGATWSIDAGDGMDDKCVFVSTNGEVAVFDGLYPGDATWQLVGRYDAAEPLGKRGHMTAGGDLLVLTKIGVIPLSAILKKDPAALSFDSVSRNIEPDWRREAQVRNAASWEMRKWAKHNIAVVSMPGLYDSAGGVDTLLSEPMCFIVNLQTGAWAKYTNWDVQCSAIFNDEFYFGSAGGKVYAAERSGTDDGTGINYRFCGGFEVLNIPGADKTAHMARVSVIKANDFAYRVGVSVNFNVEWPGYPTAANPATIVALWDVALWDVDVWPGSAFDYTVESDWVSVYGAGFVVAPVIQGTSNSTAAPEVEFSNFDLSFVAAGVIS